MLWHVLEKRLLVGVVQAGEQQPQHLLPVLPAQILRMSGQVSRQTELMIAQ